MQDSRALIREIETKNLVEMVDNPNAVIVDIRGVREHQRTGFIASSFLAPRGMIEF